MNWAVFYVQLCKIQAINASVKNAHFETKTTKRICIDLLSGVSGDGDRYPNYGVEEH